MEGTNHADLRAELEPRTWRHAEAWVLLVKAFARILRAANQANAVCSLAMNFCLPEAKGQTVTVG